MPPPFDRLFVCYVPALDKRLVGRGLCPYVAALLGRCPRAEFPTLPTVDNVPTLLTGVYPHQHGLWGPRLHRAREGRSWMALWVDALPDLVTTTAQLARHVLVGPVDLATMAPRRRRRFALHRFKYVKIHNSRDVTLPLNGMPSIFTEAGASRSRFAFVDQLDGFERALPALASGEYVLEMVELHCLDKLLHWRLDHDSEVAGYCATVDEYVSRLHHKCRSSGRGFMLVCDHGMEPVRRHVDVIGAVRKAKLPVSELDFFVENTRATFWLHTDRARVRVLDILHSLPLGQVVRVEELARFGIRFPDSDYGDVYFYAAPGCSIFPNDFHHPLGRAILGAFDWQQRPRLRNPRHRGDHGYLPPAGSEWGYMVLAHEGFTAVSERAELVDFAPSALALLGLAPPPTMRGRALFQPKPAASPVG